MQLSVFHFSRFVLVVLVSFCISACASSGYPPPLEASKLELAIVASDAVNPDEKGRSSPILVRVYELKNDAVFQESDFFTLQKQDKLTLGSDLLTKDDFILRPGETKTIRRKTYPDTTAIGILAAYRQLNTSTWRIVHKLKPAPEVVWYRAFIPANKVKLKIDLQANDIKITELD